MYNDVKRSTFEELEAILLNLSRNSLQQTWSCRGEASPLLKGRLIS